jgi:hypothetical protein
MDKDPYKTMEEIIKREHETLKRLAGGSKKVRVKKKTKK